MQLGNKSVWDTMPTWARILFVVLMAAWFLPPCVLMLMRLGGLG